MIKFIKINDSDDLDRTNLEWISLSKLCEDSIKLIKYVEPDTIGVIGVPRSGMIPATIIATHTNLPLFNISKDKGIVYTGAGHRENFLTSRELENNKTGHYLLVDDSVCSGRQMFEIRDMIEKLNNNNRRAGISNFKVYYSSVYTTNSDFVDYYGVINKKLHIFEWNIFNNPWTEGKSSVKSLQGGFCMDWDGVLNKDCDFKHKSSNENEVIDWIKNVKPHRWIPRLANVSAIISFRLEKHRNYCINWLNKWEIKCDNLKLFQADTFEERDANFDVGGYKGEFYKNSSYSLFFESCPLQSQIIADVSGKVVCCPNNGTFYFPEDKQI